MLVKRRLCIATLTLMIRLATQIRHAHLGNWRLREVQKPHLQLDAAAAKSWLVEDYT